MMKSLALQGLHHVCLDLVSTVVQISDDTVVKLCDSFALSRSESLAIDFVRAFPSHMSGESFDGRSVVEKYLT